MILESTSTEADELYDEAKEREARIQQRRQELEARFRLLAEGRPWYEGTGNDDPVLAHQWVGACHGAVAKRWFLGDEPGAGKTRTSTGGLDLVGAKKIILVVEANVASQFAGEAMTLAPHREIITLAGIDKKLRHSHLNQLLRMKQGIAVVNYEMFRYDKDALKKLMLWQADSIIVDEAHNMKNISTTNFRYVQSLIFAENTCMSCTGLVYGLGAPCPNCGHQVEDVKAHNKQAVHDMRVFLSSRSMKNVMLMTGTPLLNSPVDLFAIFHLIDPVAFPSQPWFKKTFTHPDYSQKRSVFSRNGMDLLAPLLKGRFLQRTLEEVGIFLPKQKVHIERVELDPEKYPLQARTIEQVSKYAAIQLSSGEKMTLMHVITIILRKRQANVWPGGIEMKDDEGNVTLSVGSEVQESVKMDVALEKIKVYHKAGKRQVVFSQFATALEEFERRVNAAGIRAVRFDGSTPKKLRDEIKTNFYKAKGEEPKWDVVLVHYRTGGAGLNLTAAPITHILDEEWNAGKRDQAYARNHRMGQDEETHVHVYRLPGVDTWMAGLIAMKEKMVTTLGMAMSAEKQVKMIADAIRDGEI